MMKEKIEKIEFQILSLNEKEKDLREKRKKLLQQKTQYKKLLAQKEREEKAIENEKIVKILEERYGEITSDTILDAISLLHS